MIKNKKVLVTGACGTVGRELIRQLVCDHDIAELVGLDNNESELFAMQQEYDASSGVDFFLADVRDQDKVARAFRNMDVIFHTAAFKHVILCERSPFEAVQTNILGVQNIVAAALENRVEKVIFTSSDKAVNPTNVMGTSKLMGERLMTAANANLRDNSTVFASTRFGNVLGSRGSVIPVFREQIRAGGPVTVTDPGMTRFIMSIREAVRLVIDSASLAKGGEVFVTKMPAVRIQDLAEVMIHELAPVYGYDSSRIELKTIGAKAGEKHYEELLNGEETRRTIELENYFVILPAFQGIYNDISYDYQGVIAEKKQTSYNSANEACLSRENLRKFLIENHLLTN